MQLEATGIMSAVSIAFEWADLIRRVAVQPTLQNLAVLGLLVEIRTFLSWSLDVELEGVWPWRKRELGMCDAKLGRDER